MIGRKTRKLTINPKKNILKVFHDVYFSNATNIYQDGGRSSGKTTEIAEELVDDFLLHPNGNVMCFRKVQNTLLGSCYTTIKKALIKKGLLEGYDFYCVPSRLKIVDKRTGTGFYFFGLDDDNKIRSFEVPTGYPFRYWFEEFQENKTTKQIDLIEEIVVTFERHILPEGVFHQFRYTFNRPFDIYDPINVYIDKLIDENDPDTLITHNDYRDVVDNDTGESLLSDQILKRIEKCKKNDYNLYVNRYLGLPSVPDEQIYNMELFKVVSADHFEDRNGYEWIDYYFTSSDVGYQSSATAHVMYGVTNLGNLVVVDLYYYSPDKDIKKRYPKNLLEVMEIANTIEQKRESVYLCDRLIDLIDKYEKQEGGVLDNIIDSAEGNMKIVFFQKTGMHLSNAKKKQKNVMVEDTRIACAEINIYVLDKPQNHIWLFEAQKYKWDMQKYRIDREKEVLKVDDHCVDTFQYVIQNKKNELNIYT